MEKQWAATKITLENIREVMGSDCSVVTLLNGSDSTEIREEMERNYPSFIFHYSKTNLGVAGGRNYLFRTSETRQADYIFLLDNDTIIPQNYFDDMIVFINQHPKAGVVGPLVFRANPLILLFADSISSIGKHNDKSLQNFFKINSKQIKQSWIETNFPEPMHFGAIANWKLAYCSSIVRIFNRIFWFLFKRPLIAFFNINIFSVIDRVKNGCDYIIASNIPGCASLFRKSLIENLGYYDESFNPYGGEDVDFCIRAIKAGYTNYITTKVAMLHGTDQRQKINEDYKSIKQEIKANLIIRRKHLQNPIVKFCSITLYIISEFIKELLKSIKLQHIKNIQFCVSGISEGLKLSNTSSNLSN